MSINILPLSKIFPLTETLPASDLEYFLKDVVDAKNNGTTIYDVIPDVEAEDIDTWRQLISDSGLYYKLDTFKDVVNIYYATEECIVSEYTTGGWTQV